MNHFVRLFCSALVVAGLTFTACKKDHPTPHFSPRTIHYQLHTDQDFSDDEHTITFRLHMHAGNNVVFDSALAPMLIKEIPDKAHQLIFDKLVPAGFDRDTLVVGFVYEIKNVGVSWFLDTCAPGQARKIVDYNFR